MDIIIRKFIEDDIPYKVKWINDSNNNKFLHYDLPLREDKTLKWFKSIEGRSNRADYTILYDGEPAGLIGLLNIDHSAKSAEYYICLGEKKFKGKGIAKIASDRLIRIGYEEFDLKEIYLYTEVDNISAQILFEKIGFNNKGVLENHIFYNGKHIDRYHFVLDVEKYMIQMGV